MKIHCSKLSPESPDTEHRRQKTIVSWWNELRVAGNSGATTWEVLDALERQVAECFDREPPDIGEAESLTAKAALLIAACCNL